MSAFLFIVGVSFPNRNVLRMQILSAFVVSFFLETSVGRSLCGRTVLCRTPGTGHPTGRIDQSTDGSRVGITKVQADLDRDWTELLYNPPDSRASRGDRIRSLKTE